MRIAVGTDQGVMVLKPGEDPASMWSLVYQGQHSRRIEALAEGPDGALYAGAFQGTVYKTLDGETWRSFADGLVFPSIHSLSVHPAEPEVLYAGSEPASIFRSTDGGAHWEKLAGFNAVPSAGRWNYPVPPYRAMVTALLQHPQHPKALLAGIALGGLIASLDGGLTWAERHTGLGREVYGLAMHPARPARIYAATGAGVFRSDDLATTWQPIHQGLPYQFGRAVAVSPEDPDRLMVGVNQRRDGGAAMIARSSDGGQTWQVASSGLPSLQDQSITSVAALPGMFFFGTDTGGLFASANFGDHWGRLRNTCPPVRSLLGLKGAAPAPA